MSLIDDLSPQARNVPESEIVAVFNYARGKEGLIPLWVGEGDRPTPGFISRATKKSLDEGETFYTWQRGIPPLREALADYYRRHYGGRHEPENFFVCGSGMQAIVMAVTSTCGPGAEVICPAPYWPNIAAAVEIASARPVPVLLEFGDAGWQLDVGRIEAAIGPKTRAIFVNTPSNPTGWVASRDTLADILEIARRHGLWIISDEIYSRFYYPGHRAPSFLDVIEEHDRILFVNSFSKNWSMTGWRVGWVRAHPELGQVMENLIQYSTSGVPAFLQRGAVAALEQGDAYVEEQKAQAQTARDMMCDRLLATNRVRLVRPEGSFYVFFAIDSVRDSLGESYRIIDAANIALAPGAGFGPGGEEFFRACFLRKLDDIEAASGRLAEYISKL
jgi:aspartate/methionine/tyrosine aminotransferase